MYQSYLSEANEAFSKFKNQSRLIATIRLIYFFAALVVLYFLIPHPQGWQIVTGASFVLFTGFIFLVKMYQRSEQKRNYWKTRITLLEKENQRLEYDFSNLDDGMEFYDPLHAYIKDLDIFGQTSLFSYISRASTSIGRELLANWFSEKATQTQIQKRQIITKELAKDKKETTELRLNLQTTAHLNEETPNQYLQLKKWLSSEDAFLESKVLNIIRFVLPILTVLSWIATFMGFVTYILPVFLSLIQLGIVGSLFPKLQMTYDTVGKNIPFLQKYAALWEIIENASFQEEETKMLQNKLKGSSKAAQELAKTLELFEYRMNGVAFMFLNGLFMWDVHFAIKLEKWRKEHKTNTPKWVETLAEFEALFSFASFSFNHKEYIFPTISVLNNNGQEQKNTENAFEIIEMAHPLLKKEVRISNDFMAKNIREIALITGSNMAGKSTFLRALGINMVLACAGAPVCATKFDFVPMLISSSMRIIDSLEKGESSFFAELKRLKQILDILEEADKKGEYNLILLDEILRGTNSKDRYLGSVAIMKQLLKLPATAFIASHDVELSRLEAEFPDKITNYAFEVENIDTGLHYPYKIKKGVCQNTNAVFLMQKMGIEM
ncbi:mismatch repair ATPase (MutS family) [Bernardetia litoralis DSM 6794]|uniref:Mismatch repair ATPase (MutS family) n=1 Tax=Bernardetia litoralis (strain ATCC 23117 / DSM 6794 / NBRC 15988 / NCIMB 1366 / Fx l1 / Sio-4) TaxID=880071 RepID=I4APV0_BERLS|nr:mismatch repair ATPase [Bernardetia litoralis]AFM05985.1 mismatch repair ATPase (MutS family) [Bernardetia litoralis DSM 6794]